MTGICGWIDAVGNDGSADSILSDMATCLAAVPRGVEFKRARDNAALCIRSWEQAASFHDTADMMIAIEGYPYWSSATLENLAAEKGYAASVAEAYRNSGRNLLAELHGSFFLAVVDCRQRTVLLATDRMGIHPVCFAEVPGGGFVFGSNTDAVRRFPKISSTIKPQAIFTYLHFYMIPAPQTIYSEQRKLQIGQYALFTQKGVTVDFYWQPSFTAEGNGDIDRLGDELTARLQTAIRRSMKAEDPAAVGAFLSGGLDSTTVCGLFAGISDRPARSFTIGFNEGEFDERPYARIGARHFGLDYNEYVLSPRDTLDLLPRMAAAYDEPFGNSSAIPTYYCAKLAKESGVDVMLAGDGGDEIFAGNERYLEQGRYEKFRQLPAGLRQLLMAPIITSLARATRLSLFQRMKGYMTRLEMPLPQRLNCWNTVANMDVSEIFVGDVVAGLDTDDPGRLMKNSYFSAQSQSSLQRMLRLDMQITLADGDLRKVVRMCELAGTRVKFTLLDDDLVSFAASVPPTLLIRSQRLRYFYKHAMRDFLPTEILNKQKHGFGMPFEGWLRKDQALRQLMQDCLTSFKARGFLKPAFIDRIIAPEIGENEHDVSDLAWDIMALELWMDQH